MALSWSLLLIGLIACFEVASSQPKTLYFSFITAHSDQYTALGAIPAVDLALHRINSDSTILPGYMLNYTTDVGNSMCERTLSLDVFFSRLFNSTQPQYVAMLCCGCSVAAIPVAEISHHWNVPQMAYAAASLTLNNRQRFRNFFRTMPVYTNMGISVAELAETFNWRQIAVVTESNGLFIPVLNSLQEVAATQSLRVHSLVLDSVSPFPFSDLFIWDEDYRIIFINAYPGTSQYVACERDTCTITNASYRQIPKHLFTMATGGKKAYRRGLYGPRYVWITVNWGEGWWIPNPNSTVPCTGEHLERVLYRGLTIIPSGFFIREDKMAETLSGITPAEFEDLYAERAAAEGYNPYSRYGLSYDAMWAIAVGLDNALTRIQNNDTSGCEDVPGSLVPLEDFEYSNSKMGCVLRESYHQTNFSGVTGQIMFNSNGSRINNIVTIRQYRESDNRTLMMETVGVVRVAEQVDNTTFEFHVGETPESLWPGGPPYDGSAQNVVHPIALPIVIIYNTLASVGLLCAAGCTLFNIIFRNKKIVKLSSPNLNYLIVVGAALLYTCVYLYTYTVDSLDKTVTQSVICNFRQWLSAIGYTLCFAVILSKTWRIYYIFSNPTKKKKTFHDWMLLVIVAVVVAVDVLIFLIGTAIPQTRIVANLTADVEHPSFINEQQIIQRNFIFICDDNATIWLSVAYAYKGLLQLVAMFMAFHTRKIKIRALNDSKEIAAIVYINSIILVLLIVVEFALRQYHYVYASLYGLALLVGGSLFLGLTFIPKMVHLYRDPDGDDLFGKTLPPGNGLTCTEQIQSKSISDERTETSAKEDTGALRARITQLEAKVAQLEGNDATEPQKSITV